MATHTGARTAIQRLRRAARRCRAREIRRARQAAPGGVHTSAGGGTVLCRPDPNLRFVSATRDVFFRRCISPEEDSNYDQRAAKDDAQLVPASETR